MDERKEVCLNDLHEDDFRLIVSLLSPRDFLTMKQVCKSWEQYVNTSAQGKKVLEITGNFSFFDKIKAEMDIKKHPVFFWGISNLISCLISINDPESSIINESFLSYMISFWLGAVSTIGKSLTTFQDALNGCKNIKEMVEEASKFSCVLALYAVIDRFLLHGHFWGTIILTCLIVSLADTGVESLNKYSLFYKEQPKEAYKEINKLFRENKVFNIDESETLPKIMQ